MEAEVPAADRRLARQLRRHGGLGPLGQRSTGRFLSSAAIGRGVPQRIDRVAQRLASSAWPARPAFGRYRAAPDRAAGTGASAGAGVRAALARPWRCRCHRRGAADRRHRNGRRAGAPAVARAQPDARPQPQGQRAPGACQCRQGAGCDQDQPNRAVHQRCPVGAARLPVDLQRRVRRQGARGDRGTQRADRRAGLAGQQDRRGRPRLRRGIRSRRWPDHPAARPGIGDGDAQPGDRGRGRPAGCQPHRRHHRGHRQGRGSRAILGPDDPGPGFPGGRRAGAGHPDPCVAGAARPAGQGQRCRRLPRAT